VIAEEGQGGAMLLLIFRAGAGKSLYALDAGRVVEVVPRVALRPIPRAPAFLSGLLDYRGRVVPVIDFGVVIGEAASLPRLSTRIILVEWTTRDRQARLLGIVAEDVSRVVNADPSQTVSAAMTLDEAPYLGEVIRLDEGLVQLVRADKLVPERVQDALYGLSTEPG
jgi:chemotaxis-related protein WspB